MTATRAFASAILAGLMLVGLATAHIHRPRDADTATTKRFGIFAADNGTFSGHSELFVIEQHFVETSRLQLPACQSVRIGGIVVGTAGASSSSVPVVLVYSGIGSVTAALCYQAVVQYVDLAAAVWTGTAGQSTHIGGFAPGEPGGCEMSASRPRLSLGSMCVTSKTFNMFCGSCRPPPQGIVDECSRMDCENFENEALVGQCSWSLPSALADAVAAAAAQATLPAVPPALRSLMGVWWAADGAIDRQTAPQATAAAAVPSAPTVFSNCATSIDGNLIDPSGPLNVLCRERVARLTGVNASETVCFADMEDVGFAQAAVVATPGLPIAIVRGGSNYDRAPLSRNATTGAWFQNFSYANASVTSDLVKFGYHYAIATTNTAVLAFLNSSVAREWLT